jgi:hypothetical protein
MAETAATVVQVDEAVVAETAVLAVKLSAGRFTSMPVACQKFSLVISTIAAL